MRLLLLLRASVSDLEPFKVFDLYFRFIASLLFEIKSSKLLKSVERILHTVSQPCAVFLCLADLKKLAGRSYQRKPHRRLDLCISQRMLGDAAISATLLLLISTG